MAGAYGLVGWLAASVVASEMLDRNATLVKGVGILIGVVCAVVAEFRGARHASAAPTEPHKPKS